MKARWIFLVIVVAIILLVSSIPIWSAFRDTSATYPWKAYNPYDVSGAWYKGQVHAHTIYSDGSLSPQEVISNYYSKGYKFIALTDHDTVTKLAGSGILVLGQEYGKGSTESGSMFKTHMNGINVASAPSTKASEQERIDSITSQNGIAILNHPTSLFYAYSKSDLVGLNNYTGMEIYNGYSNSISSDVWDYTLSKGKMVWGFAADDSHDIDAIGKGWIMVRVSGDLSTIKVLNAIKHGSFYSTQGPLINDISFDGKTFIVKSPGADSVSFYGRDGRLLETFSGSNVSYIADGTEGYIRAEVSKAGLKAWSQPVFLEQKSSSSPQILSEDFLVNPLASVAILSVRWR